MVIVGVQLDRFGGLVIGSSSPYPIEVCLLVCCVGGWHNNERVFDLVIRLLSISAIICIVIHLHRVLSGPFSEN